MKIRTCAALLIAVMMLILAGCGLQAAEERSDTVEDVVELHLKTPQKAPEIQLSKPEPQSRESGIPAATTTPAATVPTVPAAEATPVETLPPASSVHTAVLAEEEAEAIALKHAGFTKDQVSYLRTKYDRDDRIPEYDVEFREGRWEYEYEIHAETGKILSFEKDD